MPVTDERTPYPIQPSHHWVLQANLDLMFLETAARLKAAMDASFFSTAYYDIIQLDDIAPDLSMTTTLIYTLDSEGKPDKLSFK